MRHLRRPVTLRTRLTLVFAAATAVVLAVVGFAVYGLFSRGVQDSVDSGLRQRERAVQRLADRSRGASNVTAQVRDDAGERNLQIFQRNGLQKETSIASAGSQLIDRPTVLRAAQRSITVDSGSSRVRAFPILGGRYVVAIAESTDNQGQLAARLAVILASSLPFALLLASYLGYRLAGAALGPVEEMRARAAQITDSDLTERLPLPARSDEIRRLGRTFNALLDRLAGAFERERRIVSDASHELRTPLAVLSTELQVAAREDRTDAQRHEAVVSALEETRRLSRLADDLLVLARFDQGRLPLRLEPLDVADVLRDAARRNRGAVEAASRELVTGVDVSGGAVALADADRLAQALDNLIANALRHGGGRIDVRAAQYGATIALAVSDASGPGFGAAREQAFDRFTHGDTAGYTSSGLGLAIVAAVAEVHSGSVFAEDLPGGGARVTIEVPAA